MILLNLIVILTMTALALYSIFSLFSLLKQMIYHRRLDELQKKVIYETFSISFIVILLIHFMQFIFSLLGKDIHFIISAGYYQGALISDNPLHIDSFIFDLIVFSIVNLGIKRKYELLSRKEWLLQFILPVMILLGALILLNIALYLEI